MGIDLPSQFEESPRKSLPTFEERFQHGRQILSTPRLGDVNYVDVKPNLEVPVRTIFYSPGWLETLDCTKDLFRNWVETFGYRVVSLEHPRSTTVGEKMSSAFHVLAKKSLPRKNLAINGVLEHVLPTIDHFDVIAFSTGAIDAAQSEILAEHDSQLGTILLYNPVGLGKREDGAIQQLKATLKRYDDHRAQKKEVGAGVPTTQISHEIRDAILQNGIAQFKENEFLAKLEFFHGARSNIADELGQLQKAGHPLVMIRSTEDKLAPPELDDIPEGLFANIVRIAGFHNSLRNIGFSDLDNNQHIALEWIDALLRKHDKR